MVASEERERWDRYSAKQLLDLIIIAVLLNSRTTNYVRWDLFIWEEHTGYHEALFLVHWRNLSFKPQQKTRQKYQSLGRLRTSFINPFYCGVLATRYASAFSVYQSTHQENVRPLYHTKKVHRKGWIHSRWFQAFNWTVFWLQWRRLQPFGRGRDFYVGRTYLLHWAKRLETERCILPVNLIMPIQRPKAGKTGHSFCTKRNTDPRFRISGERMCGNLIAYLGT